MKFLLSIILIFSICTSLAAQEDSEWIRKIYNHSLENGQAYNDLEYLCLEIGHRLSGSPQAAAAVEWARQLLTASGADTVYLQPVMVPHWHRGSVETARIISSLYGSFDLNVCSIGNTRGTGPSGILGKVVEVHSREHLDELGKSGLIAKKIVFYNIPMDKKYIHSGAAYGDAAWIRSRGAHYAQEYGAMGVIIRSLGIEEDDYPHTGAVTGSLPTPSIPSVAASTKDATRLSNFLQKDPDLSLYIENDCILTPDVLSYNVIGEVWGWGDQDAIILAGAHLDSWDMGQGAHDDGAGVVQAVEVLRIFRELEIKPRHTLRIVMFMNEENGLRGALEYAREAGGSNKKHLVAMESDAGGFSPRGFRINAGLPALKTLQSWAPLFLPYLMHQIDAGHAGADIGPLEKFGVPLVGLMVDPQRYYGYHHTAADTFDKVNRRELQMGAAGMASMVFLIDKYGLPAENAALSK